MLGTFINIDDSTRDRVRLDIGRVLITTSVPEIINSMVEVNSSGDLFPIRVLEESFGDNYNRLYLDWKYQQLAAPSSDDEDSEANSFLAVLETEFLGEVNEDDLQRLNMEFPNQNFGKKRISKQGQWVTVRLNRRLRRLFIQGLERPKSL